MLDKIIMKILWIMPKEWAHKYLYKKKMHKKLDLKNPKDFNEKIHYLEIYKYGPKETICTDKYLVRNYIAKIGYSNILTKLYGVYESFEEIDFSKLPEKFVLKTNHSCKDVFVCLDKNKFDYEKAKKVLNRKLSENYAKKKFEYHYSNIKPLIMCEEYIDDKTGKQPTDYKVFCFHGKAHSILVCSNRDTSVEQSWYDINWNKLDYSINEYKSSLEYKKPINLEKMVKIAEDLSKEFEFVRVDLYNANGKIYFGELTFSPAAGFIKFVRQDVLDEYGNLIQCK